MNTARHAPARAAITAGALLSGVAAVVHALVAAPHFEEYAPFGALFLFAAMAQAAWSVTALVAPSSSLLRAGVLLNTGIVAAWAFSRTTGLPVGPDAWTPEPAAALDLVATIAELAVIAICGSLLLLGRPLRAVGKPDARRVAAFAALAVVALTGAAFGGTENAAGGHDANSTSNNVSAGGAQHAAGADHARATSANVRPSALADPRSRGLEIGLGEWSLATEARAIRPGQVTFVVSNRGKFVHGFEIKGTGSRGDDDGERERETRRLRPGETVRMTLNLAAGRYEVECFVGDHDDMGMKDVLDVRADAPLIAQSATRANTVAIKGFAFRPSTLRVRAGTTVSWQNSDSAPHNVTASGGGFSSKTLGASGAYSRRFARPGTYAYLCALHPQMRASVIVR